MHWVMQCAGTGTGGAQVKMPWGSRTGSKNGWWQWATVVPCGVKNPTTGAKARLWGR